MILFKSWIAICVKISVEGCWLEYPFEFNLKLLIDRLKSTRTSGVCNAEEWNEAEQQISRPWHHHQHQHQRRLECRGYFNPVPVCRIEISRTYCRNVIWMIQFFYWLLPWKKLRLWWLVKKGENGKSWFQIKTFQKKYFFGKISTPYSKLNWDRGGLYRIREHRKL